MTVLPSMYRAVVSVRNSMYDRGILRSERLAGPVISVGNIRVGGAGKTPFVIAFGELLKSRGIAFDVLSRGYGRRTRGTAIVRPSGLRSEFGDEPLLIARKLGVPVVVGESRYAAGLLAEHAFGPQLHLLDDGFQHRRLVRDYDIVLVTPDDARDRLLPAGRLREPVSALRRADAVVLTTETSTEGLPLEGKELIRVRRGISVAPDLPSGMLAFCAIARPEKFFQQLREAGVSIAEEMKFRDHHAYTVRDVAVLRRRAKDASAGGFITTEKDEINLGKLAGHLQPMSVVPVVFTIDDAGDALDRILAKVEQRRVK